jgi:hypothetical protein
VLSCAQPVMPHLLCTMQPQGLWYDTCSTHLGQGLQGAAAKPYTRPDMP